jgi:hypothetical protein
LADSADQTGIVELAMESVAPVGEELRQRLAIQLDDRDATAVDTALLKAFMMGMREGSYDAVEKVVERGASGTGYGGPTVPPAELEEHLPEVDPWAERYGQ